MSAGGLRPFLFLAAAIVVAAAVLSVAGGQAQTLPDEDGTVEVSAGGTYYLSLESNPTTGYSWSVESDGGAEVGEPTYEQHKSDVPLCGLGGIETFPITSDVPGEYEVRFSYARPFGDRSPAGSFVLDIRFV